MSDPVDIDGPALLADLEALNSFGTGQGAGVSRVAFSAADLAGREFVDHRLRDLGLTVRRDPLLSTVARLPGTHAGLAPIALGSHTDTVPDGGRYDGALGVVAAVACARALVSGKRPLRHPLEVINFVSEEATMGAGTLGSSAMVQDVHRALDATAWDGRPVREHLRGAGVDLARIDEARRAPGELAAYLELHIEQGATLWRSGQRLAVVEGIVGIRRYELEFRGEANHAGTTAMEDRRDALVLAAPLVGTVREIALACGIVGTVGMLRVEPGASNVIPGRVVMECELRSLDEARLDEAEALLSERTRTGSGSLRRLAGKEPVPCDPGLVAALDEVVASFGVGTRRMPSGAGHDAMAVAGICPVAMLFVPSEHGVSHAPGERTSPEDCVLGARALLAALREVDRRLD
ncbi:MAG: Zn-dependent hydrolase [Candidatus Dormibacteraeota bacterium]|nr:Zn-dependent hydrolase [Candidatus Dormibacteraeota bacterium]